MARQLFSQTLTNLSCSSSSSSSTSIFKLLTNSLSYHSRNLSTKARLIEVDLDSSNSDGGGEIEVLGLKKLEDAIHCIIARRLAPDWLVFVPGSSYWVPPKRPFDNSIAEIVENLTNPLTPEEFLSISSGRGWPSSSFYCGGLVPDNVPVKVEVQVQVPGNSGKPSFSEDED
ncbi:unnamed protein product [Amaranthus hypochondriacus]